MAKRDLTPEELAKVEAKMKTFMANKDSWVKRYGKDAEKVMRGRAITSVKKETETMNKQKLKELVRKSLMNEADIEVGAEEYFGEKDLSKASMMLDDLETKLKNHDWFYMMSDDNRAYTKGSLEQQSIRNIMKSLEDMGYGEDAKSLFNQYAPNGPGGSTLKMKEAKGKDMDKDGDIDSDDYLAARDAAIKKAMQKEDIDLGHEDNEPHMIKGELYQIGKYAMDLYAALEELEEMGGEYDFPAWWQSKITTAKNMISGAKHYLEFEMNEPKIDAAVDALTGEEYHEGEPMMEEEIGKDEMLSARLYKIKNNVQPAFYQKVRMMINNGDLEKAEEFISRMEPVAAKKDTEFAAMKGELDSLAEKKLTKAEKAKKEDIVKGMKKSFKGDESAMYAIATAKAKKVAETLAKKLKND
jgi:hypothetical protein